MGTHIDDNMLIRCVFQGTKGELAVSISPWIKRRDDNERGEFQRAIGGALIELIGRFRKFCKVVFSFRSAHLCWHFCMLLLAITSWLLPISSYFC